MPKPSYLNKTPVILATIIAFTASAASAAAAEPRTRVVGCQAESCLMVTGKRPHSQAAVSINGRSVAVQGGRNWRIRLPVETVREWSAPLARSIAVVVGSGTDRREFETRLPIGLLGQPHDLALLEIRLK